jgi:Secretion system C-terminal sorting domain
MKTLLLFIFASTLTVAQIPFMQDTIAYNNRFNNRQFAEYNSQGLLRLSYTSGLSTVSSLNEIYYVEEDMNGDFSTVNLTNNAVDDNYSTLSIDQNDKVHISYEERDPTIFQVMYMNNVSGSFSTPIAITQGGLNKATPFSKIGPDSVMHFVYYTYTNGSDNCYYRNYDLRTSTLGTETFLSNGEASGDFQATLDIDSNGKVHVALVSGTTLTSGPLKYFNNTSGTFQEIPTGVSVNVSYPRIRVDSNNEVHIIYRASSTLYYINNVSGTFSSPVAITPAGQLPAGIQSLEIDDQNRLYTTYQSSQSASGKGFFLLFAENQVFGDTILIADLPPEYVTRNSSQVVTKGNGDIAMFYAEGDVRNDTVICDIFMKRGNIYNIVPVELVSFSADVYGNNVSLSWVTVTEKNNYGFEILRSAQNESEWETIGFVPGFGTTTEIHNYTFNDEINSTGKYSYRLKQIDFDGAVNYSDIIEANIGIPNTFTLEQNYPNPFNPSTKIKFTIPATLSEVEGSLVTLKIYDVLGDEVITLVNEEKPAGEYEVEFDGRNLTSGIYFYTLKAGSYVETKKMILLK